MQGGKVKCAPDEEINEILSKVNLKIYNSHTVSQPSDDTLYPIK